MRYKQYNIVQCFMEYKVDEFASHIHQLSLLFPVHITQYLYGFLFQSPFIALAILKVLAQFN